MIIGDAGSQAVCKRKNNRAENSHQAFRRQEGAIAKFKDAKTLQKLVSVRAAIYNLFSLDCYLTGRFDYKHNRSAALTEWQQVVA